MSDEQKTDAVAGEQKAGAKSTFAESLSTYREFLQDCEQKAQEAYDKAVIVLSGGALGVSFAFVKDIVPLAQASGKPLLILAWGAWTISLGFALIGLYFNIIALGTAVNQFDDKTIYLRHPGGCCDKITRCLNLLCGILFVVGTALLLAFVVTNLGWSWK
jgi:hypothetical protein